MRKPSFKVALLIVWLGFAWEAGAATTQADVDEAKLAQDLLAARQAAAESRQKIAEADAAAAKARLGTLDLSKLSAPDVEAKTLKIEGTILSYRAMERIAVAIAADVAPRVAAAPKVAASGAGSLSPAVVLVNDQTLNAIEQFRSFKRAAVVLHKAAESLVVPTLAADNAKCEQPGPAGAGLGVLGGIDAALQIAQIFKIDRSLEGTDVTLDDFALASSVLKALKAEKVERVVLASAYLPGGLGVGEPASKLMEQIDGLSDDQVTLDVRMAEIGRRRAGLTAREGDKTSPLSDKCKLAFEAARRTYTGLETSVTTLKDRIDKFVAAAVLVDEKTEAPLLQTMRQAEALAATFQGAFLLHLKAIAGGGTTYTKKNLLWSSVGIGGGGIVAYVLTGGQSGEVVTAGTASEYGGFVEPDHLGAFLDAPRAAGSARP